MGCLGSLIGTIAWAGVCAIIGWIVSAISDVSVLFWVVSVGLFVLSLPGMLIGGIFDSFVQDKIDYVQDREDYRQMMRDMREDERREERRYERELDREERRSRKKDPDIYIDNRHININNFNIKNDDDDDDDDHDIYDTPYMISRRKKP
jgi:hypothetical protein